MVDSGGGPDAALCVWVTKEQEALRESGGEWVSDVVLGGDDCRTPSRCPATQPLFGGGRGWGVPRRLQTGMFSVTFRAWLIHEPPGSTFVISANREPGSSRATDRH